jgi:hypothetical protein
MLVVALLLLFVPGLDALSCEVDDETASATAARGAE